MAGDLNAQQLAPAGPAGAAARRPAGLEQTGVPVGLMLGGVVAPALVAAFDWRVALLAVAATCFLSVAVLQPLRARFDVDREPGRVLSPADVAHNMKSVLAEPALRGLCLAMFAFVGLQTLFTGFFVLYMVRGLGHELERAGLVFSIAVAVAVPAASSGAGSPRAW